MSTTRTEPADAAVLRERMVEELRSDGTLHSGAVIEAFRRVPRHLFTPGETPETAYQSNRSVLPVTDDQGRVVSTVSAAHIQAVMLEQARPEPGMRVLEIGSGGYNAALLSEIVGPSGAVTTVDIDPQVTDRARRCLDDAGYGRVMVRQADAVGSGVTDGERFDRIIVTARTRDVPPAWIAQLADDGRIVAPLRLRGLTRTVALDRAAGPATLIGGDARLCSFVPLQGSDGQAEPIVWLDGGRVEFRFDDVACAAAVDPARLRAALHGRRVERFSDVEFDRPDLLELWLATTMASTAVLTAQQAPIDEGLVGPAARIGVVALVTDGGFAYRMKRPSRDGFEVGVRAHGPDAEGLAERFLAAVHAWRAHRDCGGTGLRVTVFPAGTPDDQLPAPSAGGVVDRPYSRFVLDWPLV